LNRRHGGTSRQGALSWTQIAKLAIATARPASMVATMSEYGQVHILDSAVISHRFTTAGYFRTQRSAPQTAYRDVQSNLPLAVTPRQEHCAGPADRQSFDQRRHG
jgi:hypothetical protein